MHITFLECLSLQRSKYSLQCFAVNDWLLIGPEFQSYDSQHFDGFHLYQITLMNNSENVLVLASYV